MGEYKSVSTQFSYMLAHIVDVFTDSMCDHYDRLVV